MADSNFEIRPGDIVSVTIPDPVVVDVVTVAGPQGASGAPGPSYTGVAWFFGEGPPGAIPGSKPGDYYTDSESGLVWKLGD